MPDAARKAMDAATVKLIVLAILDGMHALHANDTVHLDIESVKILGCDDSWMITDFGIGKLVSSRSPLRHAGCALDAVGTTRAAGRGGGHRSADIYAMGRGMAFLLCGLV